MTHEKGDSHVYPRAPALGSSPRRPRTRARSSEGERARESRTWRARGVFVLPRAWVSDRDDDDDDDDEDPIGCAPMPFEKMF